MKVVILSGGPGCGKSTHAKGLTGNVVIVSADNYFMKSGEYKFDVMKLGEAHAACKRGFLETLDLGAADVLVVDNTNTTPIEAAFYVEAATAYDVEVEIVQFDCPPEIGFMRNVHGVPLKACYRFRDNLNNFQRDMPIHWKFAGVKLSKVNTPHTATDITRARVLAREACEKERIVFPD